MSLKFSCPNCGIDIIAKYLHPGDVLICRNCNYEIRVPTDAGPTDDESNILKSLKAKSDEIKKYEYGDIETGPEPEKEPIEPTPWGILSIIKFLIALTGLIVISSCLIGFLSSIIILAISPEARNNRDLLHNQIGEISANIMSFFIYVLSLALIYYSVVKRHHQNFFEGLHIFKVTGDQITKYVKIAAAVVFSLAAVITIISLTPIQSLIPEHLPLEEYIGDTYGKLALFTFFALIAPFAEEIIFRGYIYKGFENRLGSFWAGVIVTILFVAIHGPQLAFNPILLSFIAVVAIILIYIRIKTDNLTNCIIVHFIYNTALVAITWAVFLTVGFKANV